MYMYGCTYTRTFQNSRQLHGVWILVFANFVLFEIISVCYNIYYYTDAYYPVSVIALKIETLDWINYSTVLMLNYKYYMYAELYVLYVYWIIRIIRIKMSKFLRQIQ